MDPKRCPRGKWSQEFGSGVADVRHFSTQSSRLGQDNLRAGMVDVHRHFLEQTDCVKTLEACLGK